MRGGAGSHLPELRAEEKMQRFGHGGGSGVGVLRLCDGCTTELVRDDFTTTPFITWTRAWQALPVTGVMGR